MKILIVLVILILLALGFMFINKENELDKQIKIFLEAQQEALVD